MFGVLHIIKPGLAVYHTVFLNGALFSEHLFNIIDGLTFLEIPYGTRLRTMGIKESDLCMECGNSKNLLHLYWTCPMSFPTMGKT